MKKSITIVLAFLVTLSGSLLFFSILEMEEAAAAKGPKARTKYEIELLGGAGQVVTDGRATIQPIVDGSYDFSIIFSVNDKAVCPSPTLSCDSHIVPFSLGSGLVVETGGIWLSSQGNKNQAFTQFSFYGRDREVGVTLKTQEPLVLNPFGQKWTQEPLTFNQPCTTLAHSDCAYIDLDNCGYLVVESKKGKPKDTYGPVCFGSIQLHELHGVKIITVEEK